jgi:hypothetical protein
MPKKKNAKAKLPKSVAGMKIGKDLRNAVEPVLRFAGHPMVSDALAAALIAGADALIGGKKGDKGSAATGAAASTGSNQRSPVQLMLAVAAGEIAYQIVAAVEGPSRRKNRPAKTKQKSASKARRSSGVKSG